MDGAGQRAAVSDVDGLRVITLDSLVPGDVAGRLSHLQLAWLREELTLPAPAGSIVVLHHPPISLSPQQAAAGLQDPAALASALQGSDVHLVLCGHFHAQLSGRWGGATVWVGPGVVTRVDLTAPPTVVRAVRGAAATVVDLGGPASPLFHLLHARDPAPASRCTWPTQPGRSNRRAPAHANDPLTKTSRRRPGSRGFSGTRPPCRGARPCGVRRS